MATGPFYMAPILLTVLHGLKAVINISEERISIFSPGNRLVRTGAVLLLPISFRVCGITVMTAVSWMYIRIMEMSPKEIPQPWEITYGTLLHIRHTGCTCDISSGISPANKMTCRALEIYVMEMRSPAFLLLIIFYTVIRVKC